MDREVAILLKLKEQYQKLTGESLNSSSGKKGKDKQKTKKEPEVAKPGDGGGKAKQGKKQQQPPKPQQQQQQQGEAGKEEGEVTQKKITRFAGFAACMMSSHINNGLAATNVVRTSNYTSYTSTQFMCSVPWILTHSC